MWTRQIMLVSHLRTRRLGKVSHIGTWMGDSSPWRTRLLVEKSHMGRVPRGTRRLREVYKLGTHRMGTRRLEDASYMGTFRLGDVSHMETVYTYNINVVTTTLSFI